jgi:hypothetical protein
MPAGCLDIESWYPCAACAKTPTGRQAVSCGVQRPGRAWQIDPSLHQYRIFGKGSGTSAKAAGYVGAVVDGAVADLQDLDALGFGVWSRSAVAWYGVQAVCRTYRSELMHKSS